MVVVLATNSILLYNLIGQDYHQRNLSKTKLLTTIRKFVVTGLIFDLIRS